MNKTIVAVLAIVATATVVMEQEEWDEQKRQRMVVEEMAVRDALLDDITLLHLCRIEMQLNLRPTGEASAFYRLKQKYKLYYRTRQETVAELGRMIDEKRLIITP